MGWLAGEALVTQSVVKKIWTCPEGEHWAVRVKATIQSSSSGTVRFSLAVMPTAVGNPAPINYIEKVIPLVVGQGYDSEPFSLAAGQTLYAVLDDTSPVNVHLFGVKI